MVRRAIPGRRYPYEPDYAVAPGGTLLETIEAQGIDQRELALRTGYSTKHINQIIQGKAPISAEAAIRFERVTGVPAHFWNRFEARYREQLARLAAREQLEADMAWLKCIPWKELVERKAIPFSRDKAALLESVLAFFGVASVQAWRAGWRQPEFAFRKSASHECRDGVLASWLRLGEIEASRRTCEAFDRKRFRAALDEIRALTLTGPEELLPRMTALCAKSGVALVFVPEMRGAPVSGAAKWIARDKAMICLNLRGKSNDRFWFTFFHEAGHILCDSKREVHVDVHPTDDPQERAANRFASELLIPSRYQQSLAGLKSIKAVREFAERVGIHPGIVVGRLQREGIVPFSHFNGLKERFDWDCFVSAG